MLMIMAIQGSAGVLRDRITTQLTALPEQRVVTIDVSYVKDPGRRLVMLTSLLHHQRDVLNVVTGTETEAEIAFLRQAGAMFCHVRGPYSARLRNIPGAMSPDDVVLVADSAGEPDWYLTAEEAFSEYLIRRRNRRAA